MIFVRVCVTLLLSDTLPIYVGVHEIIISLVIQY